MTSSIFILQEYSRSVTGGFPMGMKNGKPVYMQSSYAQNQALMQALNQGNNRQQAANQAASMLLPNLGSNSSVTIQVHIFSVSKYVKAFIFIFT